MHLRHVLAPAFIILVLVGSVFAAVPVGTGAQQPPQGPNYNAPGPFGPGPDNFGPGGPGGPYGDPYGGPYGGPPGPDYGPQVGQSFAFQQDFGFRGLPPGYGDVGRLPITEIVMDKVGQRVFATYTEDELAELCPDAPKNAAERREAKAQIDAIVTDRILPLFSEEDIGQACRDFELQVQDYEDARAFCNEMGDFGGHGPFGVDLTCPENSSDMSLSQIAESLTPALKSACANMIEQRIDQELSFSDIDLQCTREYFNIERRCQDQQRMEYERQRMEADQARWEQQRAWDEQQRQQWDRQQPVGQYPQSDDTLWEQRGTDRDEELGTGDACPTLIPASSDFRRNCEDKDGTVARGNDARGCPIYECKLPTQSGTSSGGGGGDYYPDQGYYPDGSSGSGGGGTHCEDISRKKDECLASGGQPVTHSDPSGCTFFEYCQFPDGANTQPSTQPAPQCADPSAQKMQCEGEGGTPVMDTDDQGCNYFDHCYYPPAPENNPEGTSDGTEGNATEGSTGEIATAPVASLLTALFAEDDDPTVDDTAVTEDGATAPVSDPDDVTLPPSDQPDSGDDTGTDVAPPEEEPTSIIPEPPPTTEVPLPEEDFVAPQPGREFVPEAPRPQPYGPAPPTGFCGDGICQSGEDNCHDDCGPGPSGSPAGYGGQNPPEFYDNPGFPAGPDYGPPPMMDMGPPKGFMELQKNYQAYCGDQSAFQEKCTTIMEEEIRNRFNTEHVAQKCEWEIRQPAFDMARMCRDTTRGQENCTERVENAIAVAKRGLERCQEVATAEKLKEEVTKKATEMCKLKWIEESRDNLGAIGFDERFIDPLDRLGESSARLTGDYASIAGGERSRLIDVATEVQELEDEESERGFGYAMSKFFGGQVEQEKADAERLRAQAETLGQTIENLRDISENLADPAAKTALDASIAQLEEQLRDIQAQAEQKEAGAAGLLSLFGGGQ